MAYYKIMQKIRRLVVKMQNSNTSIKDKSNFKKEIEEAKNKLSDFIYYVNNVLGQDYAIFIFYYYFKGYNEVQIETNGYDNKDLKKLSKKVNTYRRKIKEFCENIQKEEENNID